MACTLPSYYSIITIDMAAKRRKKHKNKFSRLVISMCYNKQKIKILTFYESITIIFHHSLFSSGNTTPYLYSFRPQCASFFLRVLTVLLKMMNSSWMQLRGCNLWWFRMAIRSNQNWGELRFRPAAVLIWNFIYLDRIYRITRIFFGLVLIYPVHPVDLVRKWKVHVVKFFIR